MKSMYPRPTSTLLYPRTGVAHRGRGTGLLPKMSRDLQCIDLQVLPPSNLIAVLMQLSMVASAEGDSEFITDLETECRRVRTVPMMGSSSWPPSDQTWLCC